MSGLGVGDIPDERSQRADLGYLMPTLLHLIPLGATVLVVFLLVARAAIYLQNAFDAVRYPFGLDYGEGTVWQQVLLIPGPRMYGTITDAPFIVFNYPPIYHLAVRVAMSLGFDPLMAGRGLSLACSLATSGLCAWLVACGLGERVNGLARVVGCTIAALLPLSLVPIELWSVLMRVDMLAICLSFLGVAIVVKSIPRPAWLAVATPIFVLAVYTKQTALAAPAAALAVSLVLNRRQTIIAAICGAALGLLGFGLLEWLTGGGFGRHIIPYNISRFSLEGFVLNVSRVWFFMPLFVLAAGATALLWRDRLLPFKDDASFRRARPWITVAILTLWLILQTVTLMTAAKAGATVNYFIEFFYVCTVPVSILTAYYWHDLVVKRSRLGKDDIVLFFLMLVLTVTVIKYPPHRHSQLDNSEVTEIQKFMIREIAHASRPVLSDDMVLLARAGREVQIELATFRELSATKRWDQSYFLQLLSNHAFEFVIILNEYEYTAEMLAAIAQAYPIIEQLGPYTIRRQALAGERN